MTLSAIGTLATTTLTDFGAQVLIVLTAVIGIAIAYFLFKFAWRKIKGSVGGGSVSGGGSKFRQTKESYFDGSYKASQDF